MAVVLLDGNFLKESVFGLSLLLSMLSFNRKTAKYHLFKECKIKDLTE
jgi:hypothetical protein